VKPDCLSQGKGIFLTNNVDDIVFQTNNNPNERIVVQEYLKEPFLIDNLKFDIRLYVLITSCDPLKIFLYHEGIVRFATEEFKSGCLNNANIDNMFIHLTNYAINKDNGKFKHSKNALDDEGHKRSFQTVMNRLRTQGYDTDLLLL
jgi:tubulin polyglutamylase TTLL6/13